MAATIFIAYVDSQADLRPYLSLKLNGLVLEFSVLIVCAYSYLKTCVWHREKILKAKQKNHYLDFRKCHYFYLGYKSLSSPRFSCTPDKDI